MRIDVKGYPEDVIWNCNSVRLYFDLAPSTPTEAIQASLLVSAHNAEKAKLDARHVKTRNSNGMDLSYVEGWHNIAEAGFKKIFGYDAWDRRTLASRCVWSGAGGGVP